MRALYPAVLLISAAALGYEILLMRVLSIVQWHHFAYMIISVALFGYAASGTFIAICRKFLEARFTAAFSVFGLLFSITMVGCFIIGQRIAFNALEIVWNPAQFLNLTAIYLVYLVPFFFAASCIGLAFACHKAYIARIYLFDLLGAGLGAMLITAALFRLSPQYALLILAMLALGGSALVAVSSARQVRRALFGLQAVTFAAVLFVAPRGWLDLRVSEFKGLNQTIQVVDTRVLEVRSSPLALLTVVTSPTIPFRHAPGLSFAARSAPPEQLAVFADGDDMSVITRFDGNFQRMSYLGDDTGALPYQLLRAPRVLILGAGGGTGVLQALYHGASRVDAVELNPQMLNLVGTTYADFAGHLYTDPRVVTHIDEARGFVARSDERYDLIQVALLDSSATSGSGAQGLSESYLYTVEAIREYLKHTSPDGMLAITRWAKIPPRDSLKLAATAIQSLGESGAENPGRHLAMIRSWNTVTLLVRNREFSAYDVARVREFARSRSFDTAWYPAMLAEHANRYNRLGAAYFYNGISALLTDNAAGFTAGYKFDIRPATDDKPYFFHFFKWSALAEVMSVARRGGAGLIEWGYLILIATLVQVTLAGVLLILLPLKAVKRNWPKGTGARMGSYFFLLGLAFLVVEIGFIQRFILFLSHPLYSVAVVLSGFLVFAGLGSACSDRLVAKAAGYGRPPISIAVAGITAVTLVYIFLLPVLFARLIGLADAAKIAISIMLIGPLAFCMGMPFPIGLKQLGKAAPAFIPWAWGINGFASVISATLATLLAIEFGFTVLLLLAIGLYICAALIIGDPRRRSC